MYFVSLVAILNVNNLTPFLTLYLYYCTACAVSQSRGMPKFANLASTRCSMEYGEMWR